MMLNTETKRTTKTGLAKMLGISRASLYYQPKRELKDLEIKAQIESVLADNPSYGHKRIALALELNKKRILRVMKKYGIKPYRRRVKKLVKKGDLGRAEAKFKNEVLTFCPIVAYFVYVSDFTYIKYKGKFIYLATIMDMYTREVLGWNISRFHNKYLVLGAFEDSLVNTQGKIPKYSHSDQGSEYDSNLYTAWLESLGVVVSMSAKHSPWENPFQESFYSQFKVDLGDVDRFETLGELIEAIYLAIYYYNNKRIHTALKKSPVEFRLKGQRNFGMSVSK